MKNILRHIVLATFSLLIIGSSYAREVQSTTKSTTTLKETAAGCQSGSIYKYLDINNVRTLIYSYGNGWFLEDAEYEIPKGSRKMSMFSFSLWIGGIDVNNNLKLAAYRFGQGPTGGTAHIKNDYWPGPLRVDGTASVDEETCAKYDKLFPMTRAEVTEFLAWWDNKAEFPDYTIPKSIIDWPAHGDRSEGQAYYLAPFFDRDGDGTYDPKLGDYPYYDLANTLCPRNLKPGEKITRAKLRNGEPDDTLGILVDQVIKGDQTLWSVYNDKGNYHSETQGEPIGMEIRAQYFAFATNDEINNMTFYSYELVNRSTYTLTGTYFSQWVDSDLGYAGDDYVGCDVGRGLGYCYNGKPNDGTGQVEAYGAHPPAIGVDFFQGPYMDPDFNSDGTPRDNPRFTGDCSILGSEYPDDQMAINGVNFGDGIPNNERFGMRRFVYHNNGGAEYMSDPRYAPEYYLLLRGIWKDNSKMLYGGNAHRSSGAYGPECDFMFPEMSDVCDWGTGGQPPNGAKFWTEETAGNNPDDRRFMQSAGPFTLKPGACNYITVGIPWARSVSGTPWESVKLLQIADDKCQALFDNCFAVLNGPNAPDLTIEEMNKQLIIYITNRKTNDVGNNYQEKYTEFDPTIPNPDSLSHDNRNDSLYRFEGYQIYQLKDATVSAADIMDATKSRLVFQCDIQNGVTKLVNWELDQNLGGNVGTIMVEGADKGISHSFVVTEDKFATGSDNKLVNHRQYYYLAVSYAYNQYKEYKQDDPAFADGQKKPYLQGRTNIKTYTAIPHIPVGEVTRSNYGDGPVITRLQGHGNGGMTLEMSAQSIAELLAKPIADTNNNRYGDPDYPIVYNPTYEVSQGPLMVKVIDPLNVIDGNFTVIFDSMTPGPSGSPFTNPNIQFGKWAMIDNNSGNVYYSDTTTIYPYESLFIDMGLALTINQVTSPSDTSTSGSVTTDNALLSAPSAIYDDPTRIWLSGVPDFDVPASVLNWIRSGTYKGSDTRFYDFDMASDRPADPNKNYQKIQMQTVIDCQTGIELPLGGTWAPYALVAASGQLGPPPYKIGPAYDVASKRYSKMYNIASVDVVLTSDKTKWTRCPVIEMCSDPNLAQGNGTQFGMRVHRSVNVDGDTGVVSADPMYNSDFIQPYGMGWFPGYAINLETGERLNIMFAENSWLSADNGRDMLFNPSCRVFDAGGEPVFGGQHYIYIMGTSPVNYSTTYPAYNPSAYDGGSNFIKEINKPQDIFKTVAYAGAMYVSIPLSVKDQEWLSNTVKIKIRVAKPYQRYYTDWPLPEDSDDKLNNNYPVYGFNTGTISSVKQNTDKAVSDLDLINVVPNPYYAYDDYERNQLDNRIKIVNLPTRCTVTIFDLSGTLIRQFVVDKSGIPEPRSSTAGINTDAKTSIDWDLKNFAGIPIAGGVYLIHVKADNLGERTLKWFGILRPVDLNSL